jgi:hypothetical protein
MLDFFFLTSDDVKQLISIEKENFPAVLTKAVPTSFRAAPEINS